MRSVLGLGVVCLVGCGNGSAPAPKVEQAAKPPVRTEPVRIAFGDCTTSAVPFVSGPRPAPFVEEAATAPTKTVSAPSPAIPPGQVGVGMIGLTGTADVPTGFDDSNIYGGLLASGSGAGVGLGYLGHGTIGHGSGGAQNGRPTRHMITPTIATGAPTAMGSLDKEIIRRVVRGSIRKIQACYEKQLVLNPALEGTVQAKFFIAPSGEVASASAAGMDSNVASCVANTIKQLVFPKPEGAGGVQVNYPFTFQSDQPTASRTPPAAPAAKPASPAYEPGGANPLRAQREAFAHCLQPARTAAGAFVVEIAFAETGPAKLAIVGIDEPALATCLGAIVLARTPGDPPKQRCGVAFGTRPLIDPPAITVTSGDVTYNGAIVDHVQALAGDAAPAHDRSAALVEALATWTKRTPATPQTVAVRGVGMLEPIDATPMKVVYRVLNSTFAATAEYVLAKQVGTAWQPLREVIAPVVPVPLGTGRTWSGRAEAQPTAPAKDPDRVVLSVYVTTDQIWIGVSRVNDFVQVSGRNWPELEAKLASQKASTFFVERTDVEIAAADDVTYGDLVHVIEIFTHVGFGEWKVTEPRGLSARPSL